MRAVIESGSKQYLVAKGDQLRVELLNTDKKTASFDVLAIVDGEKTLIGNPLVKGASVKAKIDEPDVAGDKVVSIRFKAKKRVNKKRGHRQRKSLVTIASIDTAK